MRCEWYRLTQRVLVLQLSSEGDERCLMPISTSRRASAIDERSSQRYFNDIDENLSAANSSVNSKSFVDSLFRNFVVSGILSPSVLIRGVFLFPLLVCLRVQLLRCVIRLAAPGPRRSMPCPWSCQGGSSPLSRPSHHGAAASLVRFRTSSTVFIFRDLTVTCGKSHPV